MSNPTSTSDGFAAAMQQLSAEAKKLTVPPTQLPRLTSNGPSLETRLQELEASISRKIDDAVNAVSRARTADVTICFRQIEEHLAAIRNSETVNQKLFDSLHQELIKYRDNFLHESLQKPFIRDLLILFDDLNALSCQLQPALEGIELRGKSTQWRENLENAIHSLTEILHRMEVSEIEPRDKVDRAYHRVVSNEPADFAEDDGRIVMRVKRGFLWRDQVLRPEEVVAKRFG